MKEKVAMLKLLRKIPIDKLFPSLLSGAFSSCAIFVKYGDEIYHFNSSHSMSKDWKTVSEDIGVAMFKHRKGTDAK